MQVMSGGFGDRMNTTIPEFKVFRGQLYAVASRIDSSSANWKPENQVIYPGTVQLWCSADGESWSQINSFNPPLPESDKDIRFMETSGQDEEFLYIGIMEYGSNEGDGGLYRSADGTNFQRINGPGSGFDLTTSIAGLAVNETRGIKYLYTSTRSQRGAQVWRIPYDATSGWEKVLDLASVDPRFTGITYIYDWKDMIYVAALPSRPGGCEVFQSVSGDPGTWTRAAGVGNGWGKSVDSIAAMIEFNGFLYAAAGNNKAGGQIWRTPDGQQWQQVVSNGLGNPKNQEAHRLAVAQGKLWVVFYSEASMSAQVWRSDDGLQFVQSNLDGFGDPGIIGGRQRIIEFKGTVYWGGSKPSTGAQIWRISP